MPDNMQTHPLWLIYRNAGGTKSQATHDSFLKRLRGEEPEKPFTTASKISPRPHLIGTK